MACRLCYFSFIVFIVLISAPLTFGIWYLETGLPEPKQGTKLSCVGWITFYGFKEDDFQFNSEKAKDRDVELDEGAATFAAMYAYELSGSFHTDEAEFLPQIFCEHRQALDAKYSFLRLRDERRDCTDWLFVYGYSDDDFVFNNDKAKKRNFALDKNISIFAAIYAYELSGSFHTDKAEFLPHIFCGQHQAWDNEYYDFSRVIDESRTCKGWLFLYGYTDDLENNNKPKALARNETLDQHISLWVDGYGRAFLYHQSTEYLINCMSPSNYCQEMGQTEISLTQFMNRLSTRLTCERWIHLYGYTDSIEFNFDKAYYSPKTDYPFNVLLPWYVRYYKQTVKRRNKEYALKKNISPINFCREQTYEDNETDFFVPRKYEYREGPLSVFSSFDDLTL